MGGVLVDEQQPFSAGGKKICVIIDPQNLFRPESSRGGIFSFLFFRSLQRPFLKGGRNRGGRFLLLFLHKFLPGLPLRNALFPGLRKVRHNLRNNRGIGEHPGRRWRNKLGIMGDLLDFRQRLIGQL
jgi:hypothetical protein